MWDSVRQTVLGFSPYLSTQNSPVSSLPVSMLRTQGGTYREYSAWLSHGWVALLTSCSGFYMPLGSPSPLQANSPICMMHVFCRHLCEVELGLGAASGHRIEVRKVTTLGSSPQGELRHF